MNIATITGRFALLCGIDKREAAAWRPLIEDACAYINSHLLVDDPDEAQKKRLEMLCAAYAYKNYCMCNDNSLSSFTAGEVHIASPVRQEKRAKELWNSLLSESGDLIRSENFLFGRVI